MPETEPTRSSLPRWKRFTYSVSAKLIVSLLTAVVAIFALLGYLNIQLHRQHLEAATLSAAERVSDLIKRSTNYEMLHNNREGLYHVMKTIAEEPAWLRCAFLTAREGSPIPRMLLRSIMWSTKARRRASTATRNPSRSRT